MPRAWILAFWVGLSSPEGHNSDANPIASLKNGDRLGV
jgi:hypothetical protein